MAGISPSLSIVTSNSLCQITEPRIPVETADGALKTMTAKLRVFSKKEA